MKDVFPSTISAFYEPKPVASKEEGKKDGMKTASSP